MDVKIALLAGDGIGPEIMAQALKVLTALKLPLEFEEALVGGVAYAAFGHPLPTEVVELAKKSDACRVIFAPSRRFSD